MRVLFAFDIESRAIMLVAGDKAGDWDKWYDRNIPIAERLLAEHQDRLRKQLKTITTRKTRKGKHK